MSQSQAYLKALTLEAQTALHGHQIAVNKYPFRVGRESRGPDSGWSRERRSSRTDPNNELYLWEGSEAIHVSRDHFAIEQTADGFCLTDRKSALGTWVEGQIVGGNRRGGQVPLGHGDVIIVGSHQSGFIFKFVVEKD